VIQKEKRSKKEKGGINTELSGGRKSGTEKNSMAEYGGESLPYKTEQNVLKLPKRTDSSHHRTP